MNREYVWVTVVKEEDGKKTSSTTIEPSVSVDEAIRFLQDYKSKMTS